MSGRILVVDDLATNRALLKVKLRAAFHECLQAADGPSALEIARRERPALILLDVMLPGMSGIEVCRRLRNDPQTRDIPVVMITASGDRERRLQALAAGADDFLTKPLNDVILRARIRSLLRAREAEYELRLRADTFQALGFGDMPAEFEPPGRIGLIAGDTARAAAWRAMLAPHLKDSIEVLSPAAALSGSHGGSVPDLYMVAADMGAHGSGLRLVADLRSRLQSRHSAIVLVLDDPACETAANALDMGASDLLTLPFDAQETALRLGLQIRRKRRADRLREALQNGLEMALIDPLTGLHNRRYALSRLKRIAARSQENASVYAVMLLDLDRFKAINDMHGHAAGDAVLQAVARRLRACLRPADLLARIGGEEFLVAIPDCSLEMARGVAERLRNVVGCEPVTLPGGDSTVSVTISAGLAMGAVRPMGEVVPAPVRGAFCQLDTELPGASAQAVLASADAALLAAKTEGRNQVNVSASAA
ncbi:MAG: diguanylate cyclase [Pararhodobacter sp.]|nr:diguanylate cyclase [Pararhodobacter sp.]